MTNQIKKILSIGFAGVLASALGVSSFASGPRSYPEYDEVMMDNADNIPLHEYVITFNCNREDLLRKPYTITGNSNTGFYLVEFINCHSSDIESVSVEDTEGHAVPFTLNDLDNIADIQFYNLHKDIKVNVQLKPNASPYLTDHDYQMMDAGTYAIGF